MANNPALSPPTTTTTTTTSTTTSQPSPSTSDLPSPKGTRYTLSPESELRLEIPHRPSSSSSSSNAFACTVTLQSGSAELFGAELANRKAYTLTGTKVAIFTWHGCVIDVNDNGSPLDIVYVSEETNANVSYVNTHAQLEAMRDEALKKLTKAEATGNKEEGEGDEKDRVDGPRVMLVGPADCGKTSLARVLLAYAVKLGRTPLLIDIDPSCNTLSVPGTITAAPMTPDSTSVEVHGQSGSTIASGGTTPLVLWYGSQDLGSNPDLYKAQLDKLGHDVDSRLKNDVDGRASGFIVNTGGWIEDVGYQLLLHAADAFRINVVLILGHDRLYSMLTTHFSKRAAAAESESSTDESKDPALGTLNQKKVPPQPKVIKLPRSGGVVSRDSNFRRLCRTQCIKRYFNGDVIRKPDGTTVNQYTPCLLEVSFGDLDLHKLSSVSLSASMLPVSATQQTDPVQLTPVQISSSLKHAILAVCHPGAVEAHKKSGRASDLYLSGVAGFVAVEKVNMEREVVSLLSPCSGSLPSTTLLVGDITWME